MLVLSRKVSQRIRIGNDIVITIISLGKTVVDLGIDAPKNVKILRDELLDKVPNPMRKTGGEL